MKSVLHKNQKCPSIKKYRQSLIGWRYLRLHREDACNTGLSGTDGRPPVILYDYRPGRSGDYPIEFLSGFTGMLHRLLENMA